MTKEPIVDVRERDSLGRFQISRLEFALARATSPVGQVHRGLLDRCILSLYEDCIDAGVDDAARLLIERYRTSHRRVRLG